MPWWAHRMAEEGLDWEQPWVPRVEMVEVDRDPAPQFDDFPEDVFVGVKPEGVA